MTESPVTTACPHCDAARSQELCSQCGYHNPIPRPDTASQNGAGSPAAWMLFIERHLIPIASYLGTEAAAGIVGNRADSALTTGARRMFQSVHDRWHERTKEEYTPLTEEEAVDVARAAAATRGFEPSALAILRSQLLENCTAKASGWSTWSGGALHDLTADKICMHLCWMEIQQNIHHSSHRQLRSTKMGGPPHDIVHR